MKLYPIRLRHKRTPQRQARLQRSRERRNLRLRSPQPKRFHGRGHHSPDWCMSSEDAYTWALFYAQQREAR